MGTNVGAGVPLNGRIEIAFDRLLLSSSITRQTFILSGLGGSGGFTPEVAYDPVARVVTITPDMTFQQQQFYQVRLVTPQSASDLNGLRAIDGATLDPTEKATIEFIASASAPAQAQPPSVDFCKDVVRLFDKCAGSACHTARTVAAEGLLLDSPADIATTAVGRVAQESNTGAQANVRSQGTQFGIDMPILDPGAGAPTTGDPANSFMLYKLLMAVPAATSSTQQPPYCDGGMPAAPAMGPMHMLPWQPLSGDERARLSNLVPGREMPFPADPSRPLDQMQTTLTVDELELVSRWISQPRALGAPLVPPTCAACVP